MNLTDKEFSMILDTEFLITKRRIILKIQDLLSTTRKALIEVVNHSGFQFPENTKIRSGKISKGENYKELPYLVLDYPSLFTPDDTFAFRIMFWWGHFFSATLQLEGRSLDKNRNALIDQIPELMKEELYISVGLSPWQYHYGSGNYQLITEQHRTHMEKCEFLKISRKIPLHHWREVPDIASGYLEFVLALM